MAQALLTNRKYNRNYLTFEEKEAYQSSKIKKNFTDSSCQTGNYENIYHLTDNKMLKLYYSNVYKENVMSLSLSSSKSFIFTQKT